MATEHDVTVRALGYDSGVCLYCATCEWWSYELDGARASEAPTPGHVLAAYLDHIAPGKIGVRYNHNSKMTRGLAAQQTVYAVLRLLGVKAIRGGSVVVLGGNSEDIEGMDVQMRDPRSAARSWPGVPTAGATFLDPGERM